jgi:hypothetical protein
MMGQLMERLQVKMDANQAKMKTRQEMLARMEAKMDVNLKGMKEERMARLETMIQQHKELRCNPV